MPSLSFRPTVPTALVLVALLLTAGCIGGPTPGAGTDPPTSTATSSSPTPTSSISPSPTPNATSPTATPDTDLTGANVTLPDGPKEPPARPPTLNASSVRTYARTFEYRYAYNALWLNEYSDVTLECEVESVSERPYGYEAVVTCSGSSTSDVPPNATITPGPNGDWFTRTYRYRVDEDTTLRLEAEA